MVVSAEVQTEQTQLHALQKLDEQCVQFQLQGNYVAALESMERALVLRRHFFGLDAIEVRESCKAVAEMCNLLSMTYLQQENYTITLELLKKAEILTEHHPQERATTLNNMACYYRRVGKLHGALTCLKRALAIELQLNKLQTTADTHLNLCAVLSTMGKHSEAVEHAQSALILLQDELFSAGHDLKPLDTNKDRVSVLCIAYHNLGVEYEYLKQYNQCVASYQKGVGIAEQYLGSGHGVTITLTNSYVAARRTVHTKAKKEAIEQQRSPKKGASPPRPKQLEEVSPKKSKHPSNLVTSPRTLHNARTELPPLDIPKPASRSGSPRTPSRALPDDGAPLIRHHSLEPLRLPSAKQVHGNAELSNEASMSTDEVSACRPQALLAASVDENLPSEPSVVALPAQESATSQEMDASIAEPGKDCVAITTTTPCPVNSTEAPTSATDQDPMANEVASSSAVKANEAADSVSDESKVAVVALAAEATAVEAVIAAQSVDATKCEDSASPAAADPMPLSLAALPPAVATSPDGLETTASQMELPSTTTSRVEVVSMASTEQPSIAASNSPATSEEVLPSASTSTVTAPAETTVDIEAARDAAPKDAPVADLNPPDVSLDGPEIAGLALKEQSPPPPTDERASLDQEVKNTITASNGDLTGEAQAPDSTDAPNVVDANGITAEDGTELSRDASASKDDVAPPSSVAEVASTAAPSTVTSTSTESQEIAPGVLSCAPPENIATIPPTGDTPTGDQKSDPAERAKGGDVEKPMAAENVAESTESHDNAAVEQFSTDGTNDNNAPVLDSSGSQGSSITKVEATEEPSAAVAVTDAAPAQGSADAVTSAMDTIKSDGGAGVETVLPPPHVADQDVTSTGEIARPLDRSACAVEGTPSTQIMEALSARVVTAASDGVVAAVGGAVAEETILTNGAEDAVKVTVPPTAAEVDGAGSLDSEVATPPSATVEVDDLSPSELAGPVGEEAAEAPAPVADIAISGDGDSAAMESNVQPPLPDSPQGQTNEETENAPPDANETTPPAQTTPISTGDGASVSTATEKPATASGTEDHKDNGAPAEPPESSPPTTIT